MNTSLLPNTSNSLSAAGRIANRVAIRNVPCAGVDAPDVVHAIVEGGHGAVGQASRYAPEGDAMNVRDLIEELSKYPDHTPVEVAVYTQANYCKEPDARTDAVRYEGSHVLIEAIAA